MSVALLATLVVTLISRAAAAQDEVVMRAAEQLLRADTSLRRIWPGFWSTGPVVALGPFKGGTLVVHGDGKALGLASSPWQGSSPSVFRGRVSTNATPGPSAAFDLFAEVGGRAMVSVQAFGTLAPFRDHSELVPWTHDSGATLVATAIHESFHLHQWSHFEPLPGQPFWSANTQPTQPYRSWLDSSWVRDALSAERASLKTALDQSSCNSLMDIVKQYDEQREDRLRRMPPPFKQYEDAHERAEGIANWIGYIGLQYAAPNMLRDAEAVVAHDLHYPYLDSGGTAYRGWDAYALYHLYVVGAAKLAMLYRCGPKDWTTRIEKGEDLEHVLVRR
jgi:hypothetical protein